MFSTRSLVRIRNVLALFLILPAISLAQTPDQIFYNGKILTVDQDFSIVNAIAISGDRFS
jgi:hypothetical protein